MHVSTRDKIARQAREAERERCALLVGAWPTKDYGTFDERLKVQSALVDIAAAIRSGKDCAPEEE